MEAELVQGGDTSVISTQLAPTSAVESKESEQCTQERSTQSNTFEAEEDVPTKRTDVGSSDEESSLDAENTGITGKRSLRQTAIL